MPAYTKHACKTEIGNDLTTQGSTIIIDNRLDQSRQDEVHRDVTVPAPIQIRVYDDRLTLWNPAVLPEGWTQETLLAPHGSQPFNPDIANTFFRAGEHRARSRLGSLPQAAQRARRAKRARQIEAWGRGIERIFEACAEAGTPRPAIRFDTCGMWTEFPFAPEYLRQIPALSQKVTGEVKSLLTSLKTAMTRRQIQEQLGLRHDEHFRLSYLQPALVAGLIEMTIPDKPTSRLQKYRLSPKGWAWLGEAGEAR